MRTLVILIIGVFLAAGCSNQSDDRLKEKSGIEGQENAKGQQRTEETRAKQMEKDLAQRQDFFKSVEGIYEGIITETNVKVRLVFTPNRPIYFPSGRVRTVEEVADDLLNLNFEVYVSLQFLEIPQAPTSDCLIAGVRPDLVRGFIKVSSAESECPNRFHLLVADLVKNTWKGAQTQGQELAQQMIKGEISEIMRLHARNFSANSPEIYEFTLDRVVP